MPKKSKVEELLETLVNRVEKLENTINKPITSHLETINEPKLAVVAEPVAETVPVPQDWLSEVYSVLNRKFNVEIEPHRDAPLTTFSIIVPDEYSVMTPSQREIIHRDIRPKVITNAGGSHEVKEWAETVYKNLTPEIQAMVISDRRTI